MDEYSVYSMIRPLFRSRTLRRVMNALLTLLLVAALGLGLFKGFYWYQVRSVVEDVKQQLSLFATLEYGSIEAGFDGVAGVRDLVVTPLGQNQGLTIDAVRLKAVDMMTLMRFKSDIQSGRLPQQLGFELEGLRVDLSGAVFKQMAAQAVQGQPQPVDWLSGCEAVLEGVSDLELMQKLGYQQMVINLSGGYRFDMSTKQLQLEMTQTLDQLFSTDVSATIDLGINEFNRYNLTLAKPSLGVVTLHYQDRSYNKRLLAFCAKGSGVSEQQFVDQHVATALDGLSQSGLVLPESLVSAYRDFLTGKGDVRLQLLRDRQLPVSELPLYSPEQLLELLEPRLTVNGKPVEPLTIGWQPVAESAESAESDEPLGKQVRSGVEALATLLQAPFVEAKPEVSAVVAPALSPAPARDTRQRGYRVTGLDQLTPYIGTLIRIHTKNDFQVEGRLLSVQSSELRIYQEKGTGDATLPIAFRHIESVRVYR